MGSPRLDVQHLIAGTTALLTATLQPRIVAERMPRLEEADDDFSTTDN